jgi:hypothetical protein
LTDFKTAASESCGEWKTACDKCECFKNQAAGTKPLPATNCPFTEFHMSAVAVADPNKKCDTTGKNSFTIGGVKSGNQAC